MTNNSNNNNSNGSFITTPPPPPQYVNNIPNPNIIRNTIKVRQTIEQCSVGTFKHNYPYELNGALSESEFSSILARYNIYLRQPVKMVLLFIVFQMFSAMAIVIAAVMQATNAVYGFIALTFTMTFILVGYSIYIQVSRLKAITNLSQELNLKYMSHGIEFQVTRTRKYGKYYHKLYITYPMGLVPVVPVSYQYQSYQPMGYQQSPPPQYQQQQQQLPMGYQSQPPQYQHEIDIDKKPLLQKE